jgi:uncharacterized iron-regulated membrane protein
MSTLVIVLRSISLSLLAFAGPMTLRVRERPGETLTPARQSGTARASVVANLAAFGVFLPSLLIFSGSAEGFSGVAAGDVRLLTRSRGSRSRSQIPGRTQWGVELRA